MSTELSVIQPSTLIVWNKSLFQIQSHVLSSQDTTMYALLVLYIIMMSRFTSFSFARIFPSFFHTSTVMPTSRKAWISVNGTLLTTNSNPLVWMSNSSVKRNFILLFSEDHTISSRFNCVLVVIWNKAINFETEWLVKEDSFIVFRRNVSWRKGWWSCYWRRNDYCKRICDDRCSHYWSGIGILIITSFQFLGADMLLWQQEKLFPFVHCPLLSAIQLLTWFQ